MALKVLSAEAMAALDRRIIEEIGLPGPVLMENAALGVVEAIFEHFSEAEDIVILCGPGNNGGDGLAVARLLTTRGYRPRVLLLAPAEKLRGDAALQLAVCERLGVVVEKVAASTVEEVVGTLRGCDLIVDALFGTGLDRPLEGQWAEWVEAVAALPTPVVAVDLPSGLSGSRAALLGPHLEADVTVTFMAAKVAHVLPPACDRCGEVTVCDLGVLDDLLEAQEGSLFLLTPEELAARLEERPRDSHKGSFGHVMVVGGGAGGAGAPVLAARAAVRCGAGLVTVGVPEPLYGTADGASLESMTLALPARGRALASGALEVLKPLTEDRVLALGPGLGIADETSRTVRGLVLGTTGPLVLDADGLNAFAGQVEALKGRRGDTLLTPHPGELARLYGGSTAEVLADRLAAVRQVAARSGAVVLLKGYRTLVATPEGSVFVNPTGNAGMASGGSGDVLTGLLAALLAQGHSVLEAAQLGVYLHGLAGDLAAALHGERGLAASDEIDALPAAIERLRQSLDGS